VSVPSLTRDAKSPVTAVPILAQRVNGSICSRQRAPIPMKGVSAEVVIDELCTRIVIAALIKMALYLFMLVAL
jgi:hypothetical protein